MGNEQYYFWIYYMTMIVPTLIFALMIYHKAINQSTTSRHDILLFGGTMIMLNPINRIYELIYSMVSAQTDIDSSAFVSDFVIACTYIFAYLTLLNLLKIHSKKVTRALNIFTVIAMIFILAAIVTSIDRMFFLTFWVMSCVGLFLSIKLHQRVKKLEVYRSAKIFSIAMISVCATDFVYMLLILTGVDISAFGWISMSSYPICYTFMGLGLLALDDELFESLQ